MFFRIGFWEINLPEVLENGSDSQELTMVTTTKGAFSFLTPALILVQNGIQQIVVTEAYRFFKI